MGAEPCHPRRGRPADNRIAAFRRRSDTDVTAVHCCCKKRIVTENSYTALVSARIGCGETS